MKSKLNRCLILWNNNEKLTKQIIHNLGYNEKRTKQIGDTLEKQSCEQK